jgi:hypothetical protein
LPEQARLKASNPAMQKERLPILAGHTEAVARHCGHLLAEDRSEREQRVFPSQAVARRALAKLS